MNPSDIRKLFDKFGAQLDNDDVWEVQKAIVIKHKALERLAAVANIAFDKPQILRAERDEAVVLVSGSMCAADNKNGGCTRHEWSIGEARVVRMVDSGKLNKWGKPVYEPGDAEMGNYQITPKQAAYPYAMAEKRAKDRVILKLAGLHGLYSEDEADEFKEQQQTNPAHSAQDNAAGAKAPPPAKAPAANLSADEQIAKIKTFTLVTDMFTWANSEPVDRSYQALSEAEQNRVSNAFNSHQASIESNPFQEAAE